MVWDAVKRLAVSSLFMWAATTSGMSAVVNKRVVSVADGPLAPEPPS